MISRGTYFHLQTPPIIEAGAYKITNAVNIPATIYIRDFDGSMNRVGRVDGKRTLEVPEAKPGQLLFSDLSPLMITLDPGKKNVYLHTAYGVPDDWNVTIAGHDGPDSLRIVNHFMFPLSVEFEACPTPMACRRYCDGDSKLPTRRYEVDAMTPTSVSAPVKFISAMDGALKPDTEIRIYREPGHSLLFRFNLNDPRIQPQWTFGDVRLMRVLNVGVPA